jgi:choline monooxygenase
MTPELDALLKEFNPDLPLEKARTIPATWYRDPAIYVLESRRAFADCWLAAGRREQVAQPGSYLTMNLAGEPILIVRDENGHLRAFANVCRHRAALLMTDECGQATRLRCRYHGWTYDLAGRLRGVPEFDGVEEFCREEGGLPELAVAEWGPFVWVNGDRNAPSLADHLAPLPERSAGRIDRLHWSERRVYDVACNWKVFVDNYLDGGYHINYVHPGLAGVLDYGQYRTEMFAHGSVQRSPMKAPASGSESVADVRASDEAQYWWIFPNFMLNLYADVMDTNIVLPLGPERCRVVFDFYFAEEKSPGFMGDSIAIAERIQREDVSISEEVQRGLASRSFHSGRYSVRREGPVYQFHQMLARRLRGK